MKTRQRIIFLAIILILGFALRTIAIDKNPPELFGDEIDAGYQAYSLLKTARDYKGQLLPTYLHSFSEWRAPFLMYATAPFVAVFGLNEWGVRLPNAIFGMLTIFLLYHLTYCLGRNQKTSLLAALFLAISPWHIQYSRAAFEVALMLLLICSGTLIFLRTSKTDQGRMALLAGILFALALYTYNTANVFVPILIVILSSLHFFQTKKKSVVAMTTISFLIIITPLLIQIFFGHATDRYKEFSVFGSQEIVRKINQMRSYPNTSSLTAVIFHNKPTEWAKKIIQNYTTAFSPQFLFIHGDVTFRHSLHEIGQLFWFQLPLILLGLHSCLKNLKQKQSLFWLGWFLFAPLPASLTIDGAYHATRLILMVIPLCVFSAIGLLRLSKNFSYLKKRSLFLGKTLPFLILIIPLIEFGHYQHYYWQHYPADSWRWWHYGYKEAIQSLNLHEREFDRVVIETTYEPALIRYVFWTKYDPRKVQKTNDELKENAINNLKGFCLDEKTCFVDFGESLKEEQIKTDVLYLISQERNIPGDWDWSQSAPEWVEVIKTIRSPWGEPIFYLITAKNSSPEPH